MKTFGIINQEVLYPRVGILFDNFEEEADLFDFLNNSNVIVTTMNILSKNSQAKLSLLNYHISNVFIDEAHHIVANSWKRVRDSFDNKKLLQFTATPFRNDRKRLEGKIIFNFSLRKAQEQGYFKPINFIPIREYDLKKGDKIIAEKAVEKLREDLANGYNHILMARCVNKIRAKEIYNYYQEYEDLKPVLIHSSITEKKRNLR